MVDLGLSVKWATCNLGASKPEEMGDYYAWGETTPKAGDTIPNSVWENYEWSKGSSDFLTRYCCETEYGVVDRRYRLLLEDDAANVNIGGSWRIPTETEMKELMRKCIWKWTSLQGVEGYKIISKINGNSIFLPISGTHAVYWTASLSSGRSYSAMALRLLQESYKLASLARYNAFSVRPVFGK
jgi:hypothetical protein